MIMRLFKSRSVLSYSTVFQEFAVVLSKQLTENLATEVLNVSHSEAVDLPEHVSEDLVDVQMYMFKAPKLQCPKFKNN